MSAYKAKYYSPEINAIGSAAYTKTIRPPIKVLQNTGLGYGMITHYPDVQNVVSVPIDLKAKTVHVKSSEVELKKDAEVRQSLFSTPLQTWYTSPGVRAEP